MADRHPSAGTQLAASDLASDDHIYIGDTSALDGTTGLRTIKYMEATRLADLTSLAVTDSGFIVGDGSNFVLETGATARTSLGLAIGTDVQAYDAGLADIAGLAVTDGNIIVGDGANWVAESGATALTSLGAVALAGDTMTGLLQYSGTGHAGIRLNNLTTVQRDGLSASAGMLIYNTTDGQFQGYTTSWGQIGGGGAGEWTTDSNVVNLNTDTDTVTIGSATAGGKLFVDGDADEVQLQVQSHSTQTANPVEIQDSSANVLVHIDENGYIDHDRVSLGRHISLGRAFIGFNIIRDSSTANYDRPETNRSGVGFFGDYANSQFRIQGQSPSVTPPSSTINRIAVFTVGSNENNGGSTFYGNISQNTATSTLDGCLIQPANSSRRGLVVRGAAGQSADYLRLQDNSNNVFAYVSSAGLWSLYPSDSVTNSITNTLTIGHNSTGTPATGFGAGLLYQLESSTTAGQDVGRLSFEWITATHASRASRGDLTSYYTSTERTSISWGSNSSAALLSFFDATLVIQQATTGTTTGFTAGSGTGVNDDSTFTGNTGSTAYTIGDIVLALKNYGLLAA